jgi:hypothetical protein
MLLSYCLHLYNDFLLFALRCRQYDIVATFSSRCVINTGIKLSMYITGRYVQGGADNIWDKYGYSTLVEIHVQEDVHCTVLTVFRINRFGIFGSLHCCNSA